jgi:DUF177 domain-containing protein
MQLDLAQLGRHGRGHEHIERTYEPSAFAKVEADEYQIVAPVHLVVDVQKDHDTFAVTGRIDTKLRLECGRCLEPFEIPVNSTFDLRYVPAQQNAGEAEREVDEDDLTTSYYRNEMLELGDLMREQFQLVLPMKPLCSETCKGLCPECGTNLNTGTCTCTRKWEDARLAALKGLLKTDKEN